MDNVRNPPVAAPARRRGLAPVPEDARQHAVRMSDGVLLATDVYLPPSPRRCPALLARLPYDKAGDECFMPHVARWWTERGYAVAVQDVRGKIRSGGNLVPFRSELRDGYDSIDWVARQPWCTGVIGMIGDSYYGFTQWAAAASGHSALRAIAPRVFSADAYDALYRQGVFALEPTVYWALETWVDDGLYDYDQPLDFGVRPLSAIARTATGGRRPGGLDAWATGELDSAARPPVTGRVPALHLGGFFDLTQRGQITTWRRARSRQREPQFLIMDSVDHGWTPLRDPGRPFDDPQRSPAAMQRFLNRYLSPLLPFYDRFLRDLGSHDTAPVRWKCGHAGWREDVQWPPSRSTLRTWSLVTGRDGMLVERADQLPTAATWEHDPGHPVPSLAHPFFPLINHCDERAVSRRADVLSFTSPALDAPLDLAGPAYLTARLSADAPSAHLAARLLDVYPDGSAYRVLDGIALARQPWPRQVTVNLGHAGYRLRRGHRLQVQISSSAFPRYALNPGTDTNPWTATDHRRHEQHIILGGPQGAHLNCTILSQQRSRR